MTEQEIFAWAIAEMLAGRLQRADAILLWESPQPIALKAGATKQFGIWNDAELTALAQGDYERWFRINRSAGGTSRMVLALLKNGI